jgi:Carboxypeptidase regulatory-like domain
MMRVLSLAILAVLPAAAGDAVIRGTVVDGYTGKLLNRALVVLEAMPGTPGGVRTMRTGRLGAYEFQYLDGGAYVLKASRKGFMPIEHGQKRWNSAGQPLVIQEASASYITLRLPRYSAINGTVVDENEIGLPGHEVSVYKSTNPPEHIRDATSDDRGNYRIGGLTPGKYFVRTVGKQYEDGSYLPTYYREAIRPEQAQLVETFFEQEAQRIDIRPIPGRLLTLTVGVPDEPNTFLTLASAFGRKRVEGNAGQWSGLSPGDYEVYSESATGVFTYQRVSLSSDLVLSLLPGESNGITITGGPRTGGTLRLRRKDLAGVGQEAEIPLEGSLVPVGRWELLLEPPEGYYVSSTFPYIRAGRLDGWLEVTTRPRMTIGFRLSDGAASVTGVVKDAPYAPVYLEPYDTRQRQRAGELKAVRADAQGRYRFSNLAPGAWRLLATYEYLMPDSDVFDTAQAVAVTVTPSGGGSKDLELWVIR